MVGTEAKIDVRTRVRSGSVCLGNEDLIFLSLSATVGSTQHERGRPRGSVTQRRSMSSV